MVLIAPFPDRVEVGLLLGAIFGPVSYLVTGPTRTLDAFALSFSLVTFSFSVFSSFSSFPVFVPLLVSLSTFALPRVVLALALALHVHDDLVFRVPLRHEA